MQQLRELEKLLKRPMQRERFISQCLPDDPTLEKMFGSWNASLKSLRWQSVVVFITRLGPLESHLRKYWNLQKFSGGRNEPVDDETSDWKTNIQVLDKAIRSKMFWVHCKVVGQLGFLGEFIGRWCEGCPCHQQELVAGCKVSCDFKHCRAPELATGDAFVSFQTQVEKFGVELIPILTSEGLTTDDRNRLLLVTSKASAGLVSELRLKFAYFQQLPHALCGLGHHDRTKASRAAKHCLEQFDGISPGSLHRLARRFLDPGFSLPGEQPLHAMAARMASGEDVDSISSPELSHWVSALASVRVVERPVEGLHSRVSKTTRTAPNQSMSFISMDLRFNSMLELMKRQPNLLHECQAATLDLERSATFQNLVRDHLQLPVSLGSDRAMANLLYRDNVQIKHSDKVETKTRLSQHQAIFGGASTARAVTVDANCKVTGEHLTTIACNDDHLFFLVPHSLFSKCAVSLEDIAAGAGV